MDETKLEAIARAYCIKKGIDPDAEFGWEEFVPTIRDYWAMAMAVEEVTGLTVLTAGEGVEAP